MQHAIEILYMFICTNCLLYFGIYRDLFVVAKLSASHRYFIWTKVRPTNCASDSIAIYLKQPAGNHWSSSKPKLSNVSPLPNSDVIYKYEHFLHLWSQHFSFASKLLRISNGQCSICWEFLCVCTSFYKTMKFTFNTWFNFAPDSKLAYILTNMEKICKYVCYSFK